MSPADQCSLVDAARGLQCRLNVNPAEVGEAAQGLRDLIVYGAENLRRFEADKDKAPADPTKWTRKKVRPALNGHHSFTAGSSAEVYGLLAELAFLNPLELQQKRAAREAAKQLLKALLAELEPPKKRRRQAPKNLVPLTPEQTEAMYLVAEHKGNVTAAGKVAGKSRQAMQKLYEKARRKLGTATVKKVIKTQPLPKDRRGQEIVTDDQK